MEEGIRMEKEIAIREMIDADAQAIARAFEAQGWNKPVQLYERYLYESETGERLNLMAEYNGEFAGYVTIVWNSHYPAFRKAGIPEIVDFNVLMKFRRKGIGTRLMDEAEKRIAVRSTAAGLGVCLQSDYGAAQVLYARRGYVPDGRGAYWQERYIRYGDQVTVDDDLAIYLVKELS